MLVLFETSAGYALFKLLDEKKLQNVDDIYEFFATPEKAQEIVKLVSFKKFKDVADALESTNKVSEGKISKTLKKALKEKANEHENLAVGDAKLGNLIKEKFAIKCVSNAATAEIMRGIRCHIGSLLGEHCDQLLTMNLALAHSIGRYKVKFNPEKIDTMIVQAVSLLDDLDKELNNYVMRCREWYGWHFPELGRLIQDYLAYAKVVKAVGMRQNTANTDLSFILPEELEAKVKEEAEISMGTDISESDLFQIRCLCDQIIEMANYRTQLGDYLKNRMYALAPNLTVLLGELVGARLISHAGSLMNLAKYPSSTVQILGAEKALFRALKTKRDTPKYGIIYHAQLVGQAGNKTKGKMARKLAAKVSLATRIDALADESKGSDMGIQSRAYLETQMRVEQEKGFRKAVKGPTNHERYQFKSEVYEYDTSADSTVKKEGKKKRFDDGEESEPPKKLLRMEEPEYRKEPVEEGHSTKEKQSDEYDGGSAKKKKKKKVKEEHETADEDE